MCMQDKINAFWEISKKELEDTKAQLRNKDREMEELEERHQVEIKVCLVFLINVCPAPNQYACHFLMPMPLKCRSRQCSCMYAPTNTNAHSGR